MWNMFERLIFLNKNNIRLRYFLLLIVNIKVIVKISKIINTNKTSKI